MDLFHPEKKPLDETGYFKKKRKKYKDIGMFYLFYAVNHVITMLVSSTTLCDFEFYHLLNNSMLSLMPPLFATYSSSC